MILDGLHMLMLMRVPGWQRWFWTLAWWLPSCLGVAHFLGPEVGSLLPSLEVVLFSFGLEMRMCWGRVWLQRSRYQDNLDRNQSLHQLGIHVSSLHLFLHLYHWAFHRWTHHCSLLDIGFHSGELKIQESLWIPFLFSENRRRKWLFAHNRIINFLN